MWSMVELNEKCPSVSTTQSVTALQSIAITVSSIYIYLYFFLLSGGVSINWQETIPLSCLLPPYIYKSLLYLVHISARSVVLSHHKASIKTAFPSPCPLHKTPDRIHYRMLTPLVLLCPSSTISGQEIFLLFGINHSFSPSWNPINLVLSLKITAPLL